jgi:hypothetical protein
VLAERLGWLAVVETGREIDALERLTPLGWTGSLIAILGGLTASFLLFGYWYPFWRIADQDVLLIYDVLLRNSGLPREIVYHPSHINVLTLGGIYRLLHGLGLLETYSLATLPPATDADGFARAWTNLVQVARLISLATVFAYVAAFAWLLRRLVDDWRVALVGAFAIAYSGGIAMAIRSVKSELVSGALVTAALLILLIAARSPRLSWRPLLIGAAALLAALAVANKVQAIFPILAFPILLLAFGERGDRTGFWRQARAPWAVAGLIALALVAGAAAMPLVIQGLHPELAQGTAVRPLFGMAGGFHALLAVWIGLGVIAFALVWRVGPAETVATAAAIVAGVAIGLLPLYLFRETSVVAFVINPIESLLSGLSSPAACGPDGCAILLPMLASSLKAMLAHHSFVFHTSPRPAIFLEWLVVIGIVAVTRRGETKVALQAALLIGAVWGIDTLHAARALKQDYFHYTDPLIIIAAVLLLPKFTAARYRGLIFPAGVALFWLHVVFSQAEPIKHAWLRADDPKSTCVILNGLKRIERFPFCRG